MTREQKIAKARTLRDEGLSHAKIAARLGVAPSTVTKWLNPDLAAAWNREYNNRPERAAQKREWERDHDRRPCVECGQPTGIGAWRRGFVRCDPCERQRRTEESRRRRETIEEMFNAGASIREIAAALGTTPNSIGTTLAHMRREGWNVPPRYAMENGRRVPA